ncbi:MAG: class I SAM-dependent methyltransferase [Anaeroplasmataceae bacterium]|nr:class I SAM-dependent methyltransferase [Anaeroplasmataceae bacterium]
MKCCCNIFKNEAKIQDVPVEICPLCGLITKKRSISLEEERKRYDAHICDEGYVKYMQSIFSKISPFIQGIVLDYGCGKIHLLSDILCEQGFNSKFYDLHYYPELPKQTFDTIILVEVFEHLKDPYDELIHLEKMLNSKGRIILVTKPYDDIDMNKWWYFRDITHVSFIRKNTLSYWNLDMKIIEQKGDIFVLERI